jgi:xanthine dehydrogenase accessory factor
MHSNEHEVLKQALRWRQAGHRTVLVTVLSTFGASPRPPGSLAVISERRLISGSVSGGCVEDDLVHEVASGAFWSNGRNGGGNVGNVGDDVAASAVDFTPRHVALRTYGRDAAERERYRLPCGNALRLAIEPFWSSDVAAQALTAMGERRLLVRRLDYATGKATLTPFAGEPDFNDDEQGLCHVLGPRHRLLLIGATEVSRYLLPIAQSLGYAVTVCDPRVEYTDAWPGDEEDVALRTDMPDDAVLAFGCDERTAVVTVTHDPKLDDLALMEALKSGAFYVGALGSPITTARRKDRLRLFDLSDEQVEALRGPVGLSIGSRSPAEIAVSIAAELVQVRRLMESGADALAPRQSRPAWIPSMGAQGDGASSACQAQSSQGTSGRA